MSTLPSETMGATASKKCRPSLPVRRRIVSAKASEVSGPVAMITSPSGKSVTSSSAISTLSLARRRSVTALAKPSRSTARAPPAATRCSSAQSMMRLPRRRSSSFNSPTALVSSSLRRELEHTSSANQGETWAGVIFFGFISTRRTGMPRTESCHAASDPASPAPTTVTGFTSSLRAGRRSSPPRRSAGGSRACPRGRRPRIRD